MGDFMSYILFSKNVYTYVFTKKKLFTAHKCSTETVINASRLINKFDHGYIYLSVEIHCQKQQTYCIRLHFLYFAIANLFTILVQ